MVSKRKFICGYCSSNLERLRNEDEDLLIGIEESYGARLSFRANPVYHVENFKIIDAETGQEQR